MRIGLGYDVHKLVTDQVIHIHMEFQHHQE